VKSASAEPGTQFGLLVERIAQKTANIAITMNKNRIITDPD